MLDVGLFITPALDRAVDVLKLLLKDGRVNLQPLFDRAFSAKQKPGNPEVIELLFNERGLNDDESYRMLGRPVLRRIARSRGLRIHEALGKEDMIHLLTCEGDDLMDCDVGGYSDMSVKNVAAERNVPGMSNMNRDALMGPVMGIK